MKFELSFKLRETFGPKRAKKIGEFTIVFLHIAEHHHLVLYNRPILVVVNTNSTQGILRLVVTGNVTCVYRLDDQKDNRGYATSPQLL